MVVIFGAGTGVSVISGIMDIVLLSDIYQLVSHSQNNTDLNATFYQPLFEVVYETRERIELGNIEKSCLLSFLLILIVPEIHRLFTCSYFVLLRQYRQWNIQNILIDSVHHF